MIKKKKQDAYYSNFGERERAIPKGVCAILALSPNLGRNQKQSPSRKKKGGLLT